MVCICSLRTQQRAKSQCIKHIPPSMGWPPFVGVALSTDLYVKIAELLGLSGFGGEALSNAYIPCGADS